MDLWELSCGCRGIPQDKSQRLGVLAIREERRTTRLRRFFHVTTKYMLADQLTKAAADSRTLSMLLSSGHWNLAGRLRMRHGFGLPGSTAHLAAPTDNDDEERPRRINIFRTALADRTYDRDLRTSISTL